MPGPETIQGMWRLRVVGAVAEAGAAVVTGDDDHCGVTQLQIIVRGEELADAGVGAVDGVELFLAGPAFGVADGVDAGEVDEEDVGLMVVEDVQGVGQDDGAFGADGVGEVIPIEGAGFGEVDEFAFAGGHGGGVAGQVGEFEEGGEVGIDGVDEGQVGVPLDAVADGGDAGQHAGVGGKGDGLGGGACPEGEAGLGEEAVDRRRIGAEGQVGAKAVGADDEEPFEWRG